MIIAVLCPSDLVLLVRSGPVIRDLGGSVRIWRDNGPVLISYFYDGAVPVKVFQNRSQSGFYMDNVQCIVCMAQGRHTWLAYTGGTCSTGVLHRVYRCYSGRTVFMLRIGKSVNNEAK